MQFTALQFSRQPKHTCAEAVLPPRLSVHFATVALLLCVGTSCIDDSFRHPLSSDDSSKPDLRLVGTWDLRDPEVEDSKTEAVCRISPDADRERRLRIELPGGKAFSAQSLTLQESRFLLVWPADGPGAGEDTAVRQGWIVGYEGGHGERPRVRLFHEAALAAAMEAGEVEGSIREKNDLLFGFWPAQTKVPVVNLDSKKTQAWLGRHGPSALGPPGPVAERLARAVQKPWTFELDPRGVVAGSKEQADESLLGATRFLDPANSLGIYTVTDTGNATTLKYTMDDPDFGPPQSLPTEEIAGIRYLTVRDADNYLVYRYELVDDDTAVLVPPDADALAAAVASGGLAVAEEPAGKQVRPPPRVVTSSTEELRAFMKTHGEECFPEPSKAKTTLTLRRCYVEPQDGHRDKPLREAGRSTR